MTFLAPAEVGTTAMANAAAFFARMDAFVRRARRRLW
jgi:hypothetical protein